MSHYSQYFFRETRNMQMNVIQEITCVDDSRHVFWLVKSINMQRVSNVNLNQRPPKLKRHTLFWEDKNILNSSLCFIISLCNQ